MGNDDCEFCAGREAFHRGEPREANPYQPAPGVDPKSAEWYDTPYGFWDTGWSVGSHDAEVYGQER